MARPLGITILGGLVALAALIVFLMSVASFVVGLAFLLPFPSQGATLLWNGLLFFVLAVLLGVAGTGLLRMRIWAWGLAILAALVTLVYLGYNAFVAPGAALSLSSAIAIAVVGALFVYLLSVARSFRRPLPAV